MSTNSIEQLQTEIEKLVRAYVMSQKAAATAAVERAFGTAMSAPPKAKTRAPIQRWGRRRPPSEVAGLAERLYEAVRANPGETMAVIAPHVGESALALNRPMLHLKSEGRIRSVGQRHLTRYFPMTSKSA
jgi:hypothetical protein